MMISPDDKEIEGAYGDAVAVQFRPVDVYDYLSEPTDNMDNISLEVQFGEDDSRHVSEISSVSYQNLLDEADVSIGELDKDAFARRDSDESEDVDDVGHFDVEPISMLQLDPMNIAGATNDAESPVTSPEEPEPSLIAQTHVGDTQTLNDDMVNNHRHLLRGRIEVCEQTPPDIKSYNANSDTTNNNVITDGNCMNDQNISHNGAKPKVHKMSPGVARRVTQPTDEVAKLPGESMIDQLKSATLQDFLSAHNIRSDIADSQSDKSSSQNSCIAMPVSIPSTADRYEIENEYNYVKYTRIQQGNSYVGMRLAYSTSDATTNSTNKLTSCQNGKVHHNLDSPPERCPISGTCEKSLANKTLNEYNLTEIPLNGTDEHLVDENRTFSLSPDHAEYDNQEVESVLSDCDKSSLSMPLVEDGLSSSQNSDSDGSQRKLVRKQQQQQQRRLKRHAMRYDESPANLRMQELDAQAIMADLKAKREALDSAILDIKTAIQQSKGVSLKSPGVHSNGHGQEPVWVKREDDSARPATDREEEMRMTREEVEQHEEEYARREQERARQSEARNIKLKSQRMRMRAKATHLPQGGGFDSDIDKDYDENTSQNVRRCRGKKYMSLPIDDWQHNHNHSGLECRASNGFKYGSVSSEEYLSDEGTSYNASYIKVKTDADYDTDEETDKLLDKPYKKAENVTIPELSQAEKEGRESRAREVTLHDPDNPEVLIEGVLFRARYLGSTQLVVEGQPSKAMRMMQAQEAVGRIKAPAGESQPSTEVDLFVSTEKIMVLNTDLQEIMMDHALRTISYIADIADILVIMARRSIIKSPEGEALRRKKQAKILCHVFESDESQLIAQSIGQAFQVAYLEFLKANGIEDPGVKEMDIQDVLNQQEIYGDELSLFANKDYHKEVIVPKTKGEPLGVVIVESGWGSMVPTVVLANMAPCGAAARCGQLNIGDQIISVNGISLVGLPLSSCQAYIKNAKQQTVVKLTVVPCPPVVEVLIKRPDVKYQLGFSVQNGVICSLLRGGIAERGGIRVGHRIIEINNQSVVAVPHEKIVSLLAHSVGEVCRYHYEIHMKTMPTSIFRLLTGQDTPHYL